MFSKLDKFDGPIFGWVGSGGGGIYGIYIRGLIFGMLIGLHIWGGIYSGGGGYIQGVH